MVGFSPSTTSYMSLIVSSATTRIDGTTTNGVETRNIGTNNVLGDIGLNNSNVCIGNEQSHSSHHICHGPLLWLNLLCNHVGKIELESSSRESQDHWNPNRNWWGHASNIVQGRTNSHSLLPRHCFATPHEARGIFPLFLWW
ncbi:hypothetical protein K1719_007228 [Acacia pycnantha]|nr:hypothetical protein K1719_007228 [Acacia pycnantha]